VVNPKLPVIWYGGDYYPEQWDEETFERDIRMFKEAGINVVTLGVFSWSLIQPDENTYDFSFFEKVMDRLYKEGIYVCLATPTSAPPHWMTQKYPEILLTDVNGVKREKGGRQNFCPNSEKYRYFARNIAEKLAEHFKDHPALVLWHVNNEYLNYCYCDICRGKFQNWLKEKYGTLDELNRRWNTRFWSQTFTAWEEIPVPTTRSVLFWRKDRYQSVLPELYLDYRRFMTQSMLECFLEEYRAIKKHTPDIPVTTNLIAATFKEWNYFEWANHMDVAAWDNYPGYREDFSVISLRHSLIRGLKEGKPFVLMEQSPSQACWRWYNPQKRPGEMRLWSYHALAHGAETLMFFQLRQSKGGVEKFHGAVITHVDSPNTRVFQEVKRVGEEIKSLSDILDTRVVSQTALLFDWESWWAMEDTLTPNIDFKYLNEAEKYFKALVKTGLGVDVVGKDQNFEGYRIIVAPALYMVDEELARKLKDYVSNGGILILTTMSGIVDEDDQVVLGGYPGYLRDLMGGYVEEIDALPPEEKNEILMFGKRYECSLVFDYIKTTTAEVLGRFGRDYYMNEPAVLRNRYGGGWVYYVGSSASFDLVWDLVKFIEREHDLRAEITPPDGVEVIKKVKGEKTFYFLFNHSHEPQIVDLPEGTFRDLIKGNLYEKKARLQPLDVLILLKE
jgi:beta-galactosidase